jgi:LysM domain
MRFARSAFGVLLAGFFIACSSARPACQPVTPKVFPGEGELFDLRTLEYDDFGVNCSDKQLGAVLQKIRENNNAAPNSGAIVAVFVHGWHHGTVSGNLDNFVDDFLCQLAENERQRHPEHPRKILGVYVAWRGSRWRGWVDNMPASYYDRDAAAKRIGSGNALHDLIAIMTAANENPYSRSIFFGHSMGGLILERAYTTALRADIAQKYPTDRSVLWNPPGDLVITLNPAASAIEAWRFKEMVDDWKVHFKDRPTKYAIGGRPWSPLIVTLTSETDWATSSIMYAAARLGTRKSDFGPEALDGRPVSAARQQRLLRYSPGFTCDLLTHHLEREEAPGTGNIAQTCGSDFLKDQHPRPLGWRVRHGTDPCTEPAIHQAGNPRACVEVGGDRFRLLEIARTSAERDLYWIVRVPDEVIKEHSTFFTAHSRNLVHSLVTITEALAVSPEEPPRSRDLFSMTAEGDVAYAAAEALRVSMFGEQEDVFVSAGPPGTCEVPAEVSFRVVGESCSAERGQSIECAAGTKVTLIAEPSSLASSACATIEWQIGEKTAKGPTVTHDVTEAVRVVMTVRSDRAPRTAESRLAPANRPQVVERPDVTNVSYLGMTSGCVPGGVACRVGEEITFTATATRNDPPLQWDFGMGPVFGMLAVYRFDTPGRHRVVAVARNPLGDDPEEIVVEVVQCTGAPPPVAIVFQGERPECSQSGGDCRKGDRILWKTDVAPDSCGEIVWTFANGEVVAQREVERVLDERERAHVTLKTEGGTSTATVFLAAMPGPPSDPTRPTAGRCSTCCTFTQKLTKTHTVVRGDWLSKIALDVYKTLDWSRIYDANRGGVLKHPDRLEVGWVLRVPLCDP